MIQVSNRTAVQAAFKVQSILTAVHYPTLLCQQPALAKYGPYAQHCQELCGCTVAQAVSERVQSLPMHPCLSEADQERITAAVAWAVAKVA
jgi:UDP-2-acetamido-2-deoxy-ribo-hexuluronate aminotransferase